MISPELTATLLAVMSIDRPTVRSVGAVLGMSTQGTHHRLRKLRDAGLVTWQPGKSGTLRPLVYVVRVFDGCGSVAETNGTGSRDLGSSGIPVPSQSDPMEAQRG